MKLVLTKKAYGGCVYELKKDVKRKVKRVK